MAKTYRQIEEKLKLVDIVFELLDARLPLSSHNPMIDSLVKGKQRIALITKCDLADEKVNDLWFNYFRSQGITILPIDAKTGRGIDKIPSVSKDLLQSFFIKREKKGILNKKFRAMVLGIPNVGKSSLINRLAKRNATITGNRPGVTKAQQWIRVGQILELLDTPGILWPKFENKRVGMILAASGAIKEEILPIEEVALYIITFLTERYPSMLADFSQLNTNEIFSLTSVELMEKIGVRRGCLQKGGKVDFEKTARILLRDLRLGRIGRISFEVPEDWYADDKAKNNSL
jgi:ribosome biogenesis GTPase A